MSFDEFYRRERELKHFHETKSKLYEAWHIDDKIIRERCGKGKRAQTAWVKTLRAFFQMVK
ncbi:hypothetical protein [Paenibacillus macerans]|uniref:hypothetical protein n=1 Tax=Paenibacillus macerans TaxID=44252 RepID=UPI002041DC29|nr:hypothetical protein [Paenibacillus macerans]MCM3698952.1 hypothetical protein [Paenibacillus macerans]